MGRGKKSRLKKRKHFTIMFIPHSQKSVSKLRIPIWATKMLALLIIVLSGTVTYYVRDYLYVLKEVDRLHYVDSVNKIQAQKIDSLVQKTKEMEEKMQQLNQLDKQVREMVGLETEEKKEEESDQEVNTEISNVKNEYKRDQSIAIANVDNIGPASRGGGRIEREEQYNNIGLLETLDQQLSYLQIEAVSEQENLQDLKQDVKERLRFLAARPDRWPVYGRITSTYGYRKNPFGSGREFHDGLDIAAPYGSPIRAAGDGVVTFTGYRYGYGRMVSINHGYGYVSHYAHNSRNSVRVGERVKKGEIIARVGNSGRSTGPHVHFMIDYRGKRIDPLKVLK